jgi:hypothetical protein
VSAKFSPFSTDEPFGSANPIAEPPSLSIADSKLKRVRVLGSKNKVASIFPRNISEPAFAKGSMAFAVSSI